MQRVGKLLLCLVPFLLNCGPQAQSSQAASCNWQQWRIHSCKGFEFNRQGEIEQSLLQYQRAVDAARAEHADPDVVIDLELDVAQELTILRRLPEASAILSKLQREVLAAYRHTLLEARYWRRVRDLAGLQGNAELRVVAQQKVVQVVSHYFAITSLACLDEIYPLQCDLWNAGHWRQVMPLAQMFREQLGKNPSHSAELKYRQWLLEDCIFLAGAALQDSGKYSVSERVEMIKMLPAVCIDPHKLIQNCSLLSLSKETPLRVEAARVLIKSTQSTQQKLNLSEAAARQSALFLLMFWHRENQPYDQEAEDSARQAMEYETAKRPRNYMIMIQPQSVYAEILAKRGKPDQACEVLDAFPLPDNVMHKGIEIGPFSSSVPVVAEALANRGDEQGVRNRFAKLRELTRRQRFLPLNQPLLDQWSRTEESLVTVARAKNAQKSK